MGSNADPICYQSLTERAILAGSINVDPVFYVRKIGLVLHGLVINTRTH